MAKSTFLDFSTTAGDNTDCGGIGIQGTNSVSNFDNAFRTLMAILRRDLDNGTVFFTKATGYTAVSGDNNAFYEFTATATLTLTAAATLAADWHMIVFANGGDITIDPNTSETINGEATLVVSDGDAAYIICTGSAFVAITIPGVAGVAKLDTVNTFTKTQVWSKGADVASASTLTLGDDGNYFDVTGTTAITSIATVGVGTVIKLHFDASLTLTHHATNLILPTKGNIVTAAGDEAEFVEYASGDWRCVNYQRDAGTPLALESVVVRLPDVGTTSGTAFDFSIDPDATEIKVDLGQVQLSGTDTMLVQLGTAGGFVVTGYDGGIYLVVSGSSATYIPTTGFGVSGNTSARYANGTLILRRIGTSTRWVAHYASGTNGNLAIYAGGGSVDLGAAVTQLRLTRSGSNTFVAGIAGVEYRT